MQLESSLPVFVLGGIDGLFIVLRVVVFVVVYALYPLPSYPIVGIVTYDTVLCYSIDILSDCFSFIHIWVLQEGSAKETTSVLPTPSKIVSIMPK